MLNYTQVIGIGNKKVVFGEIFPLFLTHTQARNMVNTRILYAVLLNLKSLLKLDRSLNKLLVTAASQSVRVPVTFPSIFNLLESITAIRPRAAHTEKDSTKRGAVGTN